MKTWQETVTKTNAYNCHNTLEERLNEQARISYKAGIKKVEQSLAPHYEEDLDGIYRQNGWWLPDDILETIKTGG